MLTFYFVATFNGAVVELGTLHNGGILARSAAKWNCIDVYANSPATGTDVVNLSVDKDQYKCSSLLCWLSKENIVKRYKDTSNELCKVTDDNKVSNQVEK